MSKYAPPQPGSVRCAPRHRPVQLLRTDPQALVGEPKDCARFVEHLGHREPDHQQSVGMQAVLPDAVAGERQLVGVVFSAVDLGSQLEVRPAGVQSVVGTIARNGDIEEGIGERRLVDQAPVQAFPA